MRQSLRTLCPLMLFVLALAPLCAQPAPPIPVKVVIVTMFEVGADTGDRPGELQTWVERDHLDRVLPLPAAYHDARMNDDGELAIVTGAGTANAAATVMALGLDPRFDLSHAYWIIAGIAGGSPDRIALGSAAWARWVVDGDLGYELDAREIPADWSTGMLPLGKERPYQQPVELRSGQLFALNPTLANWAYERTRNLALEDGDALREARTHFDGKAAARSPFVTLGDEVSSSTFWHGRRMDEWATHWLDYFTAGKGVFMTSAMEDTGTLRSLEYLAKARRVDDHRVLVLRTISNYDRQPRELSAAESLQAQRVQQYSAYRPALENAYRVGHAVAAELLAHWDRYATEIPAAQVSSR